MTFTRPRTTISRQEVTAVHAILARLKADEAGQALAEYAIVLAFMGGFAHLEYYARDMLANPRKTVLVAAAIGVAVFLFSSRRR